MDAFIWGFMLGVGFTSLAFIGAWRAWAARLADAMGAL